MSADGTSGLEEERDLLLKSLRDLEQERAAGEITETDYATLKDDYTARAAAVLRAIDAERAKRPSPRRVRAGARAGGAAPDGRARRNDRAGAGAGVDRSSAPGGARRAGPARGTGRRAAGAGAGAETTGRRRRSTAITVGVGCTIAVVAVVSVMLFSGGRDPGQPVTGSVPGSVPDSVPPDSATEKVTEALELEANGQAVAALKLYDEVIAEDPQNAEALAYRGWLLKRAGLADEALVTLDRAVAADPTFADAHFFRGMVLLQDRDDPAGAVEEFKAFLANDPPADFVDSVKEVLANAEAAAAAKAAGAPAPAPAATEAPADPVLPVG